MIARPGVAAMLQIPFYQDTRVITLVWVICQVIHSLLLCYLCIYIPYSRISVCLIIYTVPYLRINRV
jgi:hypothetical protein